VLARGEGRLGKRDVKMIRCADVDDVDVVRHNQLLGTVERALGAQRRRGAACALGR